MKPSLENVLAGTYNPLSRPLFIYVSQKAAEKPEVKEFVEFAMKNAVPLIKEVKYLPLPERAYQVALEKFTQGRDRIGLRRRAGGRPVDRRSDEARGTSANRYNGWRRSAGPRSGHSAGERGPWHRC